MTAYERNKFHLGSFFVKEVHMRLLLIPFFLMLTLVTSAQVEFNIVKHDFGDLEAYSARYVDIVLSNKGNKQEWLLSVKKPMEVVYITSKQIMEIDSSIIVRLQVNPYEKGKFNYTVDIFTSDRAEPVKVRLTGNLRELDQNSTSGMTSCPDFSSRPGGKNPNNFDLTVVTIDKRTREELAKSSVTMIQNGQPIWEKRTDRNGKIKEDATLGLSYFYATHEGYFPAELGAYVNFKRNYIVVELEMDDQFVPVLPPITDTNVIATIEPEPEIEIAIEIEDHLETIETEFDSTVIAELPPSFTDLDKDNFDPEHFKPVNVVFVLDVSSSMKQVDKIELMKYALFQLTDMLRPQDKIGIVTYASDSRVLLPSTSGGNKAEIKKEVSELKAFGYTAGGDGIKLGYKEAKRAKIDDGTNHVIIITDGAFNRNSDDYERYVKKYKKLGINFSVVGIKNKLVHEEDMRDAAKIGGGHYVPIMKLADAQNNLKQEIRVLTFKHKP